MLYTKNGSYDLYHLELGYEEPSLTQFSTEKTDDFLDKHQGFDELKDIDIVAFDMYRYEYVHARLENGDVNIISRVKIDDPYLNKEKHSKYINLFKAFQNLR